MNFKKTKYYSLELISGLLRMVQKMITVLSATQIIVITSG